MAHFVWTDWNVEHVATHGVTVDEAEHVVNHAAEPYPAWHGDAKWVVWGQTGAGRYLQVIFVLESDADIDYARIDLTAYDPNVEHLYVIHARPLKPAEIRNLKKKK